MANINVLACAGTSGGNTGVFNCDFTPGPDTGVILIPAGTRYSRAQYLAMNTTLIAGTKNNNAALRIYPIQDAYNFTDKTGEPVMQNYENGKSKKVRDGAYGYMLTYESALNFYKQIKKLDNSATNFDLLFIDKANNAIVGVEYKQANAPSNFGGFNLSQLEVSSYKRTTHSTTGNFDLTYVLSDNAQFDKNAAAIVFDAASGFLVSELEGLQTVEINPIVAMTNAGVISVSLRSGGTDLSTVYNAALVLPGTWIVEQDNGTAITVSAVAPVAGGYQLTLLTAQLPAVGQNVNISLGTPSQLSAAFAGGNFDGSQKLVIVRP
jgi:hypothetical protein